MVRRCGLAALVVSALVSLGCSSESTEEIDVGPTGEPQVSFAQPLSLDGEPVCVAVGAEADARVALLVETAELVLRPPGACGYYVQCGHLDLYVDDVLNDESAVPAIDLLLRKLADRYHDGSPRESDGQPDVLHLAVQLADADDLPLRNHEGQLIEDTLELITKPSCE